MQSTLCVISFYVIEWESKITLTKRMKFNRDKCKILYRFKISISQVREEAVQVSSYTVDSHWKFSPQGNPDLLYTNYFLVTPSSPWVCAVGFLNPTSKKFHFLIFSTVFQPVKIFSDPDSIISNASFLLQFWILRKWNKTCYLCFHPDHW